MQTRQNPELSIIVPVLNEAGELPFLFETLNNQCGISFELIICDGGSSDGTLQLAEQLAGNLRHTVHCIRSNSGRGCQMNTGAAMARSDILLFLHADSRFFEQDALKNAVLTLREELTKAVNPLAGRFGLRFRRQTNEPSLAYAFYEAKARLNRPDCIRGDQGFMLSHSFFHQLGRFGESLPFLEDVKFALAIGKQASWILLPADISTSARRFEVEGLYERQVANAIIANAVICDWTELLVSLPGFYHCNLKNGRLQLYPLLHGTSALLKHHPPSWRISFWRATGRHVAANIWQLFFWLDVRRAFRAGQSQVTSLRWSGIFARYLAPLCRSRATAAIATIVVWLWFRLLLFASRQKSVYATKTIRTN